MARVILMALAGAALSATATLAQTANKPPALPVSQIEQRCIAQWQDKVPCHRIAEHARSRYGETVTAYQWQSAIGAVMAKVRQGK